MLSLVAMITVEDELSVQRDTQRATRIQLREMITGWGNKKASGWRWQLQWFSKDAFQQIQKRPGKQRSGCARRQRQRNSSWL